MAREKDVLLMRKKGEMSFQIRKPNKEGLQSISHERFGSPPHTQIQGKPECSGSKENNGMQGTQGLWKQSQLRQVTGNTGQCPQVSTTGCLGTEEKHHGHLCCPGAAGSEQQESFILRFHL